MKKARHNKKRNTAFLYESLVRELTKAIMAKDEARKDLVLYTIREAFKKGSNLDSELECYRNLLREAPMSSHAASKLIFLVKEAHKKTNKKELFNEQTNLINLVNKGLGKGIFSNFVPNYKEIANIYQIFNSDVSTKTKVLLEESVLNGLTKGKLQKKEALLKPVDSLVYTMFVKKFNEKYSNNLLSEQRTLLNQYILSFTDNGIDLKIYLDEEIGRLKKELNDSLRSDAIATDSQMADKAKQTIEILERYKKQKIDPPMIKKVLKIQNLVREIKSDA